jgi:hypothetical protein
MNTRSQSTVEIYHAHVADSDSVATVSTSKTQVFVKRFDGIDSAGWHEIIEWCQDKLYRDGYREQNWSVNYPSFYFTDEREYTLFLLRWSK